MTAVAAGRPSGPRPSTQKPPPPHVDPSRADPDFWPTNATQTELRQSRRDEYRDVASAALFQRNAQFDPIPEPQPPDAKTVPRAASITHIRQRAEPEHREARVRAGLLPENTATNPGRELLSGGGMGYVESPHLPSRSVLLQTRQKAMKHDCEHLHAQREDLRPPQPARTSAKDALECELHRSGDGKDIMTFTKLKDARRCERVEYDMSNFAQWQNPRCRFPKFSDRSEIPFWVPECKHRNSSSMARSCSLSRTASEPTFKVTDAPFERDAREDPFSASADQIEVARQQVQEYPKGCFGNGSNKRWTAEMLDRGQGPNRPRLFDSIPVLRVGPRDLEELDFTSTLAPVRETAQQRKRDVKSGNATNPLRSQLWRSQESAMDALAALPSCVAAVDAGAPGAATPPRELDAGGLRSRANSKGSSFNLGQGAAAGRDRSVSTAASGGSKAPPPGKAPGAAGPEPALRTAPVFHASAEPRAPREPRFFGGSLDGSGSLCGTGVRCGGFQRTVRAPHPPPPARGGRGKSRSDRLVSSTDAPATS